jgi:7-cyano-7-deazaguanine synthase
MDSTVLLAKMLDDGHAVTALSVNYNQRHRRELDAARAVCDHYDVEHVVVDLSDLHRVMRGSSQTDDIDVPEGHYADENMKKTVVPNRNMILLSVATAHCVSLGYDVVAYGAHAGDHAIYPDCRPVFVDQMKRAMRFCDYSAIDLWSPFQSMDKGDIADLGVSLDVPFHLTWTCYKGEEKACGKCGACVERLEAFAKFGHVDPGAGYER